MDNMIWGLIVTCTTQIFKEALVREGSKKSPKSIPEGFLYSPRPMTVAVNTPGTGGNAS
jgi:hypothetical protein